MKKKKIFPDPRGVHLDSTIRFFGEKTDVADATNRARLPILVDKLARSVSILIRIIETRCSPEREKALIALSQALMKAYFIGNIHTRPAISAAVREQARAAGRARAKRRDEDPEFRVIKSVVDKRYRPGDEERPYHMASAMLDDINRELRANRLPELPRNDKIARYLKTLKSPRS
jgi:hypothetical protein